MRRKYSYAKSQWITFALISTAIITLLLHILLNLDLLNLGVWRGVAYCALTFGAGLLLATYAINTNLYGASRMAPLPIYTLTVTMLGNDNSPLISSAISLGVAFMMWYYMRAYDSRKRLSNLFTASFICGAIPLMIPSALPLLLFPLVAPFFFGRGVRDFLISGCAILLPLIMATYGAWVGGEGFCDTFNGFISAPFIESAGESLWELKWSGAFVVIFMVLTLFTALRLDATSRTFGSRMKLIFATIMVILCATMPLLPSFEVGAWVVLATPFAIVIPSFRR